MNIPPIPHEWRVSPKEAVKIQRELVPKIKGTKPQKKLRLIAGADAAFSKDGKTCIAGVTLWDKTTKTVLEQHAVHYPLAFPYIPGLLSFREAPAVLEAFRKLHSCPDALIVDGHGYAHPRRLGIAGHLGILLDLPTVGCAKSRLTGTHGPLGQKRGSTVPLMDKKEKIGVLLRTQNGVNPLFISIGHKIDLKTAVSLVLACAFRYRLPEPTRLSDHLVSAAK